MVKNEYKKLIILILLIISLTVFSKTNYGKKKILNMLKIQEKLKNKGLIGILIYILIGILLNVFLFLYIIINLSSGYIFGFKKGFIIAYIIVICSSIIGFYLSKYLLKDDINTFKNKYHILNKLHEKIHSNNLTNFDYIKYIILFRLSPIPFQVSNYLFGSTNVNIFIYIIGTMIGVLPWLIIEVYIGSKFKNISNVL
jgi:uncharacterized membrane protein YdjX (TVP38/TMEM64 family)